MAGRLLRRARPVIARHTEPAIANDDPNPKELERLRKSTEAHRLEQEAKAQAERALRRLADDDLNNRP